jgi:hypothetical protein
LNQAVATVYTCKSTLGPFTEAEAAADVLAMLRDEDPAQWEATHDELAQDPAIRTLRRFAKQLARLNPDQYVIPGFDAPPIIVIAGVPRPLLRCTPQEARNYIKTQESWIEGTAQRFKTERKAMVSLKRVVRVASAFCLTPGMTIEDGLEARQRHMQRPSVRQRKNARAVPRRFT